jgi:ABC-2 type transport system ATP-binding protein
MPTVHESPPTTAERPATVPAISVTGVSKSYGDVRAVTGLSFTVEPGRTIGLLGPNGAGKSTTLDMLLGLVRPDAGEVRLFGQRPADAIRSGRVGAMLQTGGMMPEVRVRDVIRLAHRLARHPLPVDEIMRQADIEDIARHRVDKLSGGQRQRLRFALAIVEDPELIVLDEPTAGMDVAARNRFWQTMRAQARAGRTLLFATHYMEEADSAADRVLVMHEGRLLADSTPAELKARAGLRRIAFTASGAERTALRSLPGVTDAHVHGESVVLRSTDSDATVRALVLHGPPFHNLEITGLGLEQAYLSLTGEQSEPRNEPQSEPRDESRNEPRDKSRNEPRDESREKEPAR